MVTTRRVRTLLLWLPLLLAGSPPLAAQETVAVVVGVEGRVEVLRAGRPAPLLAAAGLPLVARDRLEPGAGARATLLHSTGRMEIVAQTTVLLPSRSADDGLFSRTLATLRQVAALDARQQPNRQGMIRPIPGGTVAVAPRNDVVVLESRPTLTWSAVAGAANYTVQLWTEGERPLRFSTSGPDTTASLPAELPPLRPGHTYRWSVAAAPDGRPAAPQSFRVAGEAEHASLETALQTIRAAGLDPAGDGLLLAALAYREAGLLYQARDALDRLEARGVALGADALRLRAQILAGLGDGDGAERALAQAERQPEG